MHLEHDPHAHLSQGIEELGLEVSPRNSQRLLDLARLVVRWSPRINLTGHRDLSNVISWLVLDALAMDAHLPPGQTLLDLGSGAGFPGIPLAILNSRLDVVLVDSRQRRHHFQKAVIRELDLPNVRAELGRSEQISEPVFDVVVAQALAAPARALELIYPWLGEAGWAVLACGPNGPGPLGELSRFGTARIEDYTVPTLSVSRTVWMSQRVR